MKRYHYYILAAAIALASCTKETQKENFVNAPAVIASQESYSDTKTTLSVDGGVGTIYWLPNEDINVFFGSTGAKYTSTNTENVTVASFETSAIIGSSEGGATNIWGLYPYNSAAVCNGSKVTTTIPSTQYGVPETFDTKLFTTLAHSTTRELQFFNVCGGVKFSLSRSDIKKITFRGNSGEVLAGKVDIGFSGGVPVATSVEAVSKITLTPKTGSTFSKDVNYYIITLPVSMTGGFTMTFETSTQIGTLNYTEKAVTITRSEFSRKENIDTYATFVDRPEYTEDLSAIGTANCYIVSDAGKYKFKAVEGNSATSVGDVKGVKVLWETFGTATAPKVGDLIKADVSYSDGYITFSTNNTYKEGNAVIAAYSDAACTNGKVLWSWHIWLTDKPEEQVYKNNAGTMMDRNLGATSATPGDVGALGLIYQWGRKDPFLSGDGISSDKQAASTLSWPAAVTSDSNIGTIAYSVAYPTTFITNNSSNGDWYYTGSVSTDNTRWQTSDKEKGLYDPCPQGWRVPDGGNTGVWATAFGSSSNFEDGPWDETNDGMNFGSGNGKLGRMQLGSATTIWYPALGYRYGGGGKLYYVGGSGRCWSCTPGNYLAYDLTFYYTGRVGPTYGDTRAGGRGVRCLLESK